MRVLLFCPCRDDSEPWPATLQAIEALSWPEGSLDIEFSQENPHADDTEGYHTNVLHQYQVGRALALESGYDAMLTVESDIIVPPDALTKLLEADAPVVYGLYCFRRGDMEWSVHTKNVRKAHRLGKSYSRTDLSRRWWGRVVDAAGLGLGCTLLRREVLEAVPFRAGPLKMACDYWLALDCLRLGIKQVGHLGVVCGHILRDGSGAVWPSIENHRSYEVIPLEAR